MNRFLRAAVAAVIPVASLACMAATASASSATEFTIGFGGPGFDGSVVVQSLPDSSVIAVTKHGFGPGGSTSIRRIGVDGSTAWVTTLIDGADNGFYGAEYMSAALLDHDTVLVAGYADPAGVPNGHFDIVLLAVKADGHVSTVDTWGGPGSDFGREIDVCADGSFYVGGGSWDASASPAETDAIGMADIFVTRFGADMTRQWTRAIGSTNNDNLYGLNCRADNSVDLNAWAAGSVNGQGSNAHYNFFTARMDASGNTVRTIVSDLDPGEWNPQGGAYAPDGSYYVVGESNSYYPGLPCTERALGGSFVSHYSEDGVLLWRSILACANVNRKIAVGASGDLFVLGGTDRRVAGQQKFGGSDILIHRYSSDGTRVSTRQFGTEMDDVATTISLDPTGHLYAGGYSKKVWDGLSADDDWDARVMRFDVGDVVPPTTSTTGPVVAQSACTAATTTMLADSDAGRPIWFYGDDIGEARMAALWDYASTHNPRDFGRVIGADQNWFGACKYAGVGLGTGSGYSWHDRNVVLWMWADAVDLDVARQSIMNLIDSLVPPTTTVAAPATTTTVAAPVTSAPTAPAVSTTSTGAPEASQTLAIAQVPVAAGAAGSTAATVTAAASTTRTGPTAVTPSHKSTPKKTVPKKTPSKKKTTKKVSRVLRVQR
jgi:hypothetical protein